MFKLPTGGDRSPDAAWVELSRWQALTSEQRRKFPPIAPDFVIELRSPTDDLELLRAKMQEYMDAGVRLGWMFNPQDQQVEIYHQGQSKRYNSCRINGMNPRVSPDLYFAPRGEESTRKGLKRLNSKSSVPRSQLRLVAIARLSTAFCLFPMRLKQTRLQQP